MWIINSKLEEIVVELKRLFPARAKTDGLIEDYAQILQLLANRAQFEDVFREVSEDVEDMYRFNRDQLDLRNSLTSSFYDLFRAVQSADPNVGCNFPMSHESIVIMKTGVIKIQNVTLTGNARDLFGGIVSRGYLFKDETGPSHGEYAHTIQWLVIAYAKYYEIIKLAHPVVTLYMRAAGAGSVSPSKFDTLDADSDQPASLAAPVWSVLVDCFRTGELYGQPEDFGKNLFVEDYRSPGYLTDQMLYRRLRSTFLGVHIQKRYEKRNITTGLHSRTGFRDNWLGKQKKQKKQECIKYVGATTNTLAPTRESTAELIKDLSSRTEKNQGTSETL